MELWCDSADSIKKVKTVFADPDCQQPLEILSRRMHGNFLLITIKGIDSPESAMKYKSKELFANRKDIVKNESSYFIADLIGLDVYDFKSGELIGKVSDVFNRGAGDIIQIDRCGKKQALVPMVKEFLEKIDLDSGIYINVIEGLLD